MKISYFDTSALLPILVSAHPNHQSSLSIFEKALTRGKVVTTTAHTYAELYSNLTKLPFGLHIPPANAAQAIIENLGSTLTVIDLTRADYEAALRRCAERGLTSGIIYDALHLQAAIKAEVDVLYTANLRDFKRLYSDELKFRLEAVG